jgi:rhodanese-related sulfurtransferase
VIARALHQTFVLLAFALVPALVSGFVQLRWNDAEPLAVGEVRAATVQEWGAKAQWVDARPRDKFAAGHIEGALLLNEDEWGKLVPAFLDAWDPDRPVVVYCDGGSCEASHAVARRLREELKIGDVHVLKGGLTAWPAK